MEGSYGVLYHDQEKGIQTRTATARIVDGDQDAVFTSQHCKMSSWTNWCAVTIEGGTGKYEGYHRFGPMDLELRIALVTGRRLTAHAPPSPALRLRVKAS